MKYLLFFTLVLPTNCAIYLDSPPQKNCQTPTQDAATEKSILTITDASVQVVIQPEENQLKTLSSNWIDFFPAGEQNICAITKENTIQCQDQTTIAFSPLLVVGKTKICTDLSRCLIDGQWFTEYPEQKIEKPIKLVGGDTIRCILDQEGKVYCVGIEVPALKKILTISGNNRWICALDVDRQIHCWGKDLPTTVFDRELMQDVVVTETAIFGLTMHRQLRQWPDFKTVVVRYDDLFHGSKATVNTGICMQLNNWNYAYAHTYIKTYCDSTLKYFHSIPDFSRDNVFEIYPGNRLCLKTLDHQLQCELIIQ